MVHELCTHLTLAKKIELLLFQAKKKQMSISLHSLIFQLPPPLVLDWCTFSEQNILFLQHHDVLGNFCWCFRTPNCHACLWRHNGLLTVLRRTRALVLSLSTHLMHWASPNRWVLI